MGPKGINWTEAFQFYCETVDGRLPSYQDVANKFDVNITEVRNKNEGKEKKISYLIQYAGYLMEHLEELLICEGKAYQ